MRNWAAQGHPQTAHILGVKALRQTAEQARKSPEEQEREVFDEVKTMRREYAQSRSR